MPVSEEQLLAELEDAMQSMPPRESIRHKTPENLAWFGRVSAVISEWNPGRAVTYRAALDEIHNINAQVAGLGLQRVFNTISEARNSLRMKVGRPLSAAVGHGNVYEYFEELRKIVESAATEVFFVDPYLSADIVSRYLPLVKSGVAVRLLTSDKDQKKLLGLLAAVDLYSQQQNQPIAVRSTADIHDRYLFVDRAQCFQSGASFKDGARFAPTTVTQVLDAFSAMATTYESLWTAAKIER